mgnify:FL=1
MELKPEEITKIIRSQIKNYENKIEVSETGVVILVGDGIAEVTPAYVMVLVDSAERPEDIDKNRAEAARIRAEERLQHQKSMHEYYQSQIALQRAMQRLQAASKYKR